MKLNSLERTLTCCLVGAATIAIASGWKHADPPKEDQVRFVGSAGLEKSVELGDDESVIEDSVSRVRFELVELVEETVDKKLDRLVEAFEKATSADKEGIRSSLKEALTKVFRERTEAQRTRIAGMKERLNAIESQLDRRSMLEEQIVQRRLGELLGDKDELSWDHEPAIEALEIAERRRESREPIERALEFITEFPKEFPTFEDNQTADQRGQQRAKKSAEERTAETAKRAREAQKSAAKTLERVRSAKDGEAILRDQRSRMESDRKKIEVQLPALEGLRESLLDGRAVFEEFFRGRDAQVKAEALRAELEAVQAQSEMLKKQLDELSKPKSEGSKKLGRP